MATKTRPDIKWLINETAVLQGELERIELELARLTTQRESVERARAACQHTLDYQAGRQVRGLPTVRAHRHYGRYGALKEFMLDTLREASPAQFTTSELAEKALAHFGLTMSCTEELYDFKVKTVGRGLRWLLSLGLIERLTTKHRVAGALGTWRLNGPITTFAQMEQQWR